MSLLALSRDFTTVIGLISRRAIYIMLMCEEFVHEYYISIIRSYLDFYVILQVLKLNIKGIGDINERNCNLRIL